MTQRLARTLDRHPTVIRTTTDFFEAYLSGNRQAALDLTTDGQSPTTKIILDLMPGSRGSTVAVPALPVVHLRASVSPSHDLTSWRTCNCHVERLHGG